ncbi:glycosyltransferase family 2 protein [bacterium]|nr:glycosyltransferase family 2 protein [candidate division CSSED10-310 bacterium]
MKKLVVIIPCYNESHTIADVIASIPSVIENIDTIEILVIDDGSTDNTMAQAEHAGAQVIRHSVNQGLGAAFLTGIHQALQRNADIIVNIDGDGQFNPKNIPELIAPILNGYADFTTCTRFAEQLPPIGMPRVKKYGNKLMNTLINHIVGNAHYTDVSCGFRAYSRETALKLNLRSRFTYTQESFIDLAAKGTRISEIALPVRGVRSHGSSRMASNLWRYSTRALLIILRSMRDYHPLKFFGYIAITIFFIGGTGLLAGLILPVFTISSKVTSSVFWIGIGMLLLGIILGFIAFMADMIARVRKIQEELLVFTKRAYYNSVKNTTAPDDDSGSPNTVTRDIG